MRRLLSILLLATLVYACDDPRKVRACSCDVEGAQRCNGNDVEECIVEAGCLEWIWMHDCADSPEGPICEMRGEMAGCRRGCVDECVNLGDTICSFDVLMRCESDYYYESEGCNVWPPAGPASRTASGPHLTDHRTPFPGTGRSMWTPT